MFYFALHCHVCYSLITTAHFETRSRGEVLEKRKKCLKWMNEINPFTSEREICSSGDQNWRQVGLVSAVPETGRWTQSGSLILSRWLFCSGKAGKAIPADSFFFLTVTPLLLCLSCFHSCFCLLLFSVFIICLVWFWPVFRSVLPLFWSFLLFFSVGYIVIHLDCLLEWEKIDVGEHKARKVAMNLSKFCGLDGVSEIQCSNAYFPIYYFMFF